LNSEAKFFFDTYAIIEMIKSNQNYMKYRMMPVLTSIMNYGEFYYWTLKHNENPGRLLATLKRTMLVIEEGDMNEAVEFRFKNKHRKLSYVDCIGYAMAKRRELIFLTGDNQFRDLPNVEFVK
jgi:predicted nucleic acid-binding protein